MKKIHIPDRAPIDPVADIVDKGNLPRYIVFAYIFSETPKVADILSYLIIKHMKSSDGIFDAPLADCRKYLPIQDKVYRATLHKLLENTKWDGYYLRNGPILIKHNYMWGSRSVYSLNLHSLEELYNRFTYAYEDSIGKCTKITYSMRSNIIARDNSTFQYCGIKFDERQLEIDHVIPVSKGGTNEEKNLVAACINCNSKKSTRYMRPNNAKRR